VLGQGWFPALQLHFVNSCVLLTVVFQRHCSITTQPLGQMGLGRSTTVLQPEAVFCTLVPALRQRQSTLALHSHVSSSSAMSAAAAPCQQQQRHVSSSSSSSRVIVSISRYTCTCSYEP
jgi:hypothetical protein